MECLAFQQETTPTGGRDHIQGVVQYKKRISLSVLVEKYPGTHWEKARGNIQQCVDYCTKEETRTPGCYPAVYGEPKNEQGKRARWEEIKTELEHGVSVEDLVYANPNLAMFGRAMNFLNTVVHNKQPERTKVQVYWVHGPPGCGKSYQCRKFATNPYVVRLEADGRMWFNGYQTTQKFLIIEEMRGWDDTPLLRMVLDHYDLLCPVKMGDPVKAGWTTVLITSNDEPPRGGPIMDRIDVVVSMSGVSRRKPTSYCTTLIDTPSTPLLIRENATVQATLPQVWEESIQEAQDSQESVQIIATLP